MTSTFHVYFGADGLAASPKIRCIAPADCFAALAEGFDDALEMPTYPAFLGLFYALAGVALVSLSSFVNALQLVFPLAAGFALVERESGARRRALPAYAEGRSDLRAVLFIHCAPRVQAGRGRHRPDRLVRTVDAEGRLNMVTAVAERRPCTRPKQAHTMTLDYK
jgi:hypothetical protein